MSDETKKPGGREYSVDEILAEYGSKGREVKDSPAPRAAQGGKTPQRPKKETKKVVEFPTGKLPNLPPEEDGDQPPIRVVEKPRPKEAKPMPEVVPSSVGRAIGARIHTLLRRADNFADHMYDQAEPDEETRKAEKYIPGVDQEEITPPSAPPAGRPRLRVVRPRELPPDVPPAKLAAQYQKGLKGQGVRLRLAAVLSALAALACHPNAGGVLVLGLG